MVRAHEDISGIFQGGDQVEGFFEPERDATRRFESSWVCHVTYLP